MPKFPSRFRRLDDILADLAVEDPLLLTELDGYLTGIAVCPEPITSHEWLPLIWGGNYAEVAPFEDPADPPMFTEMVLARHAEILRDLARGKLQPILDVDERNGEVLWEEWIAGFAMALELRPHAWSDLAGGEDAAAASALAGLLTLVDIVHEESALTSIEINAICDGAVSAITRQVPLLYAGRVQPADAASVPGARSVKIGRNDPCPCGSGKKHKRCCGAD
jgi:uncharacterized protein